MYLPVVDSFEELQRYQLGAHHVIAMLRCTSSTVISYKHVAYAFENLDGRGENLPVPMPNPVYAVAAETNSMLKEMGLPPSYFLGIFPGDGHMNMGALEDWADEKLFVPKALAIIAEHFKVSNAPELILRDFRKP